MEFAILGPLRAVGAQGPIELKAPKQRALLAALLLAEGDGVVTPERLIDAIWGDEPPASGHKALQVHVSQLRRVLGSAQPIVTRPAGYAIAREPGGLDLERFEALVTDARRARGSGNAGAAAERLREAIGLFRGPPLADVPLHGDAGVRARPARRPAPAGDRGASRGRARARRARRGRRGARRARRRASLPRAAPRPLVLALYRSGRQADALEAYRRIRRSLVDDLGLEPAATCSAWRARSSRRTRRWTSPRRRGRRRPPLGSPRRPCPCRRRRCSAASGSSRRARSCSHAGRPPGDAHGAGRDRQDPAGPGAARGGWSPLRRRGGVRSPGRGRRRGRRGRGDRGRARRSTMPATSARWPAASCCWCPTTSSRCSAPRRSSRRLLARRRGHGARDQPRACCGSPASTSWPCRRSAAGARGGALRASGRARASTRLRGDRGRGRGGSAAARRPAAGDRARRRARESAQPGGDPRTG